MAASIYDGDAFVTEGVLDGDGRAAAGLRPWVTNEHEHNGLRADTAVLDQLIGLVRGRLA